MEREGNLRVEMLSRQILMLKKKCFHALSLCDSSDPSAILTQTLRRARARLRLHSPLMDGKL